MNTVQKGDISEAKVLARFVELGYTVFLPWSNGLRYDILIEKDDVFHRIQVKTGWFVGNGACIRFNVSNVNGSSRKVYTYDKSEIDYFAIYCPDNDKTYIIDVEKAGNTAMVLRLKPTKNNQTKTVKWAKDYEL